MFFSLLMDAKKLKQLSIIPKKELGQSFLRNKGILEREVEYAKIDKNEVVLEIGGGIGNLTELLAKKSKRVIVIEKDTQFRECLEDLQNKYPNIDILWGDALEINFPRFDKVVSNLPFKVALPLTFKVLKQDFKIGVLIYQKRLAKKLSSLPSQKGYSGISVRVQRYADFRFLEEVKRNDFFPSPDVDCAIVKIEKTKPKFEVPSEEFFKHVLDYLFFKREKRLKEVLLGLRKFKKLDKLKILQNRKIKRITPKEFGMVTNILYKNKIKIPRISNELKRKAQKFK